MHPSTKPFRRNRSRCHCWRVCGINVSRPTEASSNHCQEFHSVNQPFCSAVSSIHTKGLGESLNPNPAQAKSKTFSVSLSTRATDLGPGNTTHLSTGTTKRLASNHHAIRINTGAQMVLLVSGKPSFRCAFIFYLYCFADYSLTPVPIVVVTQAVLPMVSPLSFGPKRK